MHIILLILVAKKATDVLKNETNTSHFLSDCSHISGDISNYSKFCWGVCHFFCVYIHSTSIYRHESTCIANRCTLYVGMMQTRP